ncbi:ABC transporter permease [Caldisericum exile]|uniref:Dipeptide ABC transporter permease protein n=1 Tax=Caldisericum exile (strain DSM 21853 / NBRC 104410 / AZM16c01) TaxID=511051 RepID=A0A7U6JG04_CALEA|nr:ABC transporter permease [Caldisericum exile]BAL81049.1 putative dipeptide ABC transporter permease protein [Caldisericum exile AZM16c01]
MRNYIIKRFINILVMLFAVSIIIFLLVRFIPGDPARTMAGEHASKEILEEMRKKWGLDKPIWEQYLIWLKYAIRGDFGRSILTHESVLTEITLRFPNTLELSIFAMLFASIFGITAGIISAIKRYTLFDYITMFLALFGVSMPIFWLAIMLVLLFSIKLNLLPTGGRLSVFYSIKPITHLYLIDSLLTLNFGAFFDALKHLILPSIALGTIPMAFIARITRSSMLNVISQDYIRTARAKGLPERTVIVKHALRNALIPILTSAGTEFAMLMGGAVLTETIFYWPGLGTYIVQAVNARDYPAIQGAVIFVAFVVAIVNLIVDVLYAYIDPRIHY